MPQEIIKTEQFESVLSDNALEDSFNRLLKTKSSKNGTRGAVDRFEVGGTNFISRLYRRGGLVSKINETRFLQLFSKSVSTTRPFRELRVLEFLSKYPISQPAAAMVVWDAKRFSYQGMIVTVEIPESKNLLELKSRISSEIQALAVSSAAKIALKILNEGIFHTDLHLGNVLMSKGEVFIIDFDKAKVFDASSELEMYKDKTISRWSRSVKRWIGDDADSTNNFVLPFIQEFK